MIIIQIVPIGISPDPYMSHEPIFDQINGEGNDLKLKLKLDNNINIHLSYHMINNNLDSLIQDVHNLVYEGHYRKADGIWETSNDESTFVIYELSGEVATPIQFYVTDKKNHFLRGSMYPITKNKIIKINRDSLKPVIEFYKKDIVKIIETIKWSSSYY